ncbi:MAG: YciI family protein [Gemmatimonadaceae bacterium]
MAAFFCKLIPPRATFAQDMSEAEATVMQEHAAYWHDFMSKGRVLAFGLVGDPAGAYGIGIVEVDNDAEVRALTANDPTILSGRGFRFEVYPMPLGAAHP